MSDISIYNSNIAGIIVRFLCMHHLKIQFTHLYYKIDHSHKDSVSLEDASVRPSITTSSTFLLSLITIRLSENIVTV